MGFFKYFRKILVQMGNMLCMSRKKKEKKSSQEDMYPLW